jgi:putative endonuclease
MEGYSIYVLRSEVDQRLYVGMSKNIKRRLDDHFYGRVFSTKGYRPWKLVYTEFVGLRIEARKREKFLKTSSGKRYIKNIIMPR